MDVRASAYRLMWRLGMNVRPPLYQSFRTLALLMGIFFGGTWGLAMFFVAGGIVRWVESEGVAPRVRTDAELVTVMIVASLLAGLGFGLSMATYYRRKARGLRLPVIDGQPTAA